MKLNSLFRGVEINLPVLNKFLCCLPLRPGLIFCAILQLIATVVIAGFAIGDFYEKIHYRHVYGFEFFEMVTFFTLFLITSFIDTIFCMFLLMGAKMKNVNFLEVCYHYQKVKVIGYAVILVTIFFVKLVAVYYNWFDKNFDNYRKFIMVDDQALGFIDLACQFYLFLLVRSYILKLEHQIDFSTLYQRLRSHPGDTAGILPKWTTALLPQWQESKPQENLIADDA